MIISSTNRITHTAHAGQTEFSYTFYVDDEDDLQVYLNGTLQESGYTVSGVGDDDFGAVTFDAACSEGDTVLLYYSPALTQELELSEGEAPPSKSLERALDKSTQLIIAAYEQLGRSVKLPVTSDASDIAIPEPEADKYLAWNADADALENKTIADIGAIALPLSIANGGTGGTTAAAARAALDAEQANSAILKSDTHAQTTKAITGTAVTTNTDDSYTPDLRDGFTQPWAPTSGTGTFNTPTFRGAGVWVFPYNGSSAPTLFAATFDGSTYSASGDLLVLCVIDASTSRLFWVNAG